MNQAQVMTELVVAVFVALLVVRFWKQIVATFVVVVVTLSVVGALTLMHAVQDVAHR